MNIYKKIIIMRAALTQKAREIITISGACIVTRLVTLLIRKKLGLPPIDCPCDSPIPPA